MGAEEDEVRRDGEVVTHPNIEQRDRACRAILHHLRDGDWHPRREMGKKLKDEVAKDWLFGFIKKEQRIEHMQQGGRFYWRLPARPRG